MARKEKAKGLELYPCFFILHEFSKLRGNENKHNFSRLWQYFSAQRAASAIMSPNRTGYPFALYYPCCNCCA